MPRRRVHRRRLGRVADVLLCALGEELAHGGGEAVVHGVDVDRHHGFPVLQGEVEERLDLADAGVGDHGVDGAEGGDGGADERGGGVGLGYVGGCRGGVSALAGSWYDLGGVAGRGWVCMGLGTVDVELGLTGRMLGAEGVGEGGECSSVLGQVVEGDVVAVGGKAGGYGFSAVGGGEG